MNAFEISKSEELVFELICRHAPVSMAEIIALLQPHSHWSESTIKTFVRRMETKGALLVTKDKVKKYTPAFTLEEYRFSMLKDICDKEFEGSSKALVLNFIQHNHCTKEELLEMKQLLDEFLAEPEQKEITESMMQRGKE